MTDTEAKTNLIPHRYALIRSRDSGVWFGVIDGYEYTPAGLVVRMPSARRIWSWTGAAELSQIATTGNVGSDSRIAAKTAVTVIDVCEVQRMTDGAYDALDAHKEWVK